MVANAISHHVQGQSRLRLYNTRAKERPRLLWDTCYLGLLIDSEHYNQQQMMPA